jgi:hypothetical protein
MLRAPNNHGMVSTDYCMVRAAIFTIDVVTLPPLASNNVKDCQTLRYREFDRSLIDVALHPVR